jgi:SAM-dependent methyltransferase
MHATQPTQSTQPIQATQPAQPTLPSPATIPALPTTPALTATAALPTTPALPPTAALPTTPALPATAALPTTAALPATAALPTTAVLAVTAALPTTPALDATPALPLTAATDVSSDVTPRFSPIASVPVVRPAQLDIAIPDFPPGLDWINARIVRLGTLLGQHAVLVWFWDYCSLNSLRSLPYLKEWDRRYREHGLRVFGVHSPQFEFGRERANVEAAVERLEIDFPVASDSGYEIWKAYGNEVWPALYLWDRRGVLRYYHFAEGAYEETERAVQELLLEIDEELALPNPMGPVRDTDAPDALVRPPTAHAYLEPDRSGRPLAEGERLSIRYAGVAAAAVLDGRGEVDVIVDGRPLRTIELDGARLYDLAAHATHGEHDLALVFRAPARAYAFSFAPGVA